MSASPLEINFLSVGFPSLRTRSSVNDPVIRVVPVARAAIPYPHSCPEPPAFFAWASVPSGLYLAMKTSHELSAVRVFSFASPSPNAALNSKFPVVMTEPSGSEAIA